MSIFKCKMCGGTIEFEQGATVGVCDSCGTKQTLPKTGDDVIANLFNRANNLRLKCEFDKAEQIYEKIVQQDDSEAEAHWGIVLCKYGIEYVEDPKTFQRIPTCHRTLFDAVTADPDYLAAVDYSDAAQQSLYESEARAIDRIQKDILAIVKSEKPFDIFICYKETDETGKRTVDSTIANDIYYQLTQEGFKVFYAAITLEDKLGQEYEPYIFAALNSAKVMLVIGTKPEYFGAVWVKNEWSRYLKLMKTDRSKLLIPCYRDMDAYDLPEEFAHLQAQDMSKIGFINDVVRGIKKVIVKEEITMPSAAPVVTQTSVAHSEIAPLLKRIELFLEDGDFAKADDFCEQVLNIDPECAEAYLGKLMADLQVKNRKQLADCAEPFDDKENYGKVLRFGDDKLKAEMSGYITHINERNENARLTGIYNGAVNAMNTANSEEAYKAAAEKFQTIPGYKDADSLAEQCLEKAEVCRKDAIYNSAKSSMTGKKVKTYETAIELFQTIPGWKDADEQIDICRRKIEEIEDKEIADRIEAKRKAEEEAKKRKKIIAITVPIVCACFAFLFVLEMVIIPNVKYNEAMELYNAEKYQDAYTTFNEISYKDSESKALECLFLLQNPNLSGIKKGDTVKFGFYEQDNNWDNGKEEIEWIVLNVAGNKALVISKYALDFREYNFSYEDEPWEKCTLRTWLNGTFLNSAFGSKHQEFIPSVSVPADKNPEYSTNPGNATKDKVFLLSITEAEKYFTTDESRKCAPTAYATAQGESSYSNNTTGWWLRTPGNEPHYAAVVYHSGMVTYYGNSVGPGCRNFVRPAMWIKVGS